MAGYSVKEANIEDNRRPLSDCKQCCDTGFVNTVWGLRECPMCSGTDSTVDDTDVI